MFALRSLEENRMTDPSRVSEENIPTLEETTALEKLKAEASSIRIANRLVLITGLLCVGAGFLTLFYSASVALVCIMGGGFLASLTTSNTPTRQQKHHLPKLASTRDPEALGPLCTAALCGDPELRDVAEAALAPLLRLHLESDRPQLKSEAASLLKVLARTRNVDLICSLLDWIAVVQPDDAVRTLDRLIGSRRVPSNSTLYDAVVQCRATLIAARQQSRSGGELLRASSLPIQRGLLLPAEPGKPVDPSNLLRPAEGSEKTD
jgi:hypothetical protein